MAIDAAFSGDLEFLSLGEVIQIIGNNGGTGVLRIKSKYADGMGVAYFDKGDPIDASSGDLTGTEALYSLFGWTEGEFSFRKESVNRKNIINKNRMEIILDGCRLVDDGKIAKLGPVTYKKGGPDDNGEKTLPLIRGPFVDYMYVVDEEEFNEGDDIVIEGNYGNWLWVILEGIVEISKDTTKGPFELLRLSDGAYVGSITSVLSEGCVRKATAKAKGRVQLGMLDSQRLANEFAGMSPEFMGVVKSMDNRLKKVTDTIVQIRDENIDIDAFVKNKKPVIEQGKNESRIFSITNGNAAIVRKTDRGYIPLALLEKGDFFGDLPFLKMGHEPHAASVYASKDMKITALDVAALQKEHEKLSSSFRNIIENLTTSITVTTMIACDQYPKSG
jgi:CRP-like cAMP-binding protein